MLAGMELQPGRKKNSNTVLPLANFGITKIQSSRAQQVYRATEPAIEAYFAARDVAGGWCHESDVRKLGR